MTTANSFIFSTLAHFRHLCPLAGYFKYFRHLILPQYPEPKIKKAELPGRELGFLFTGWHRRDGLSCNQNATDSLLDRRNLLHRSENRGCFPRQPGSFEPGPPFSSYRLSAPSFLLYLESLLPSCPQPSLVVSFFNGKLTAQI